ncbi:DUF6233 domain-containing protein [Streptomyces sp. NPDC006132]|uniref:DUF6233 domain-containing protein n=1 Tax=Streptomyces sp. NPDC006132 TaxID=3156732 RepID=UPI0033F2AF7D
MRASVQVSPVPDHWRAANCQHRSRGSQQPCVPLPWFVGWGRFQGVWASAVAVVEVSSRLQGPVSVGGRDCEEAPQGAPLLDVEHASNVAENPGTQLCTLCGAGQELTPLLSGFEHITDSAPGHS